MAGPPFRHGTRLLSGYLILIICLIGPCHTAFLQSHRCDGWSSVAKYSNDDTLYLKDVYLRGKVDVSEPSTKLSYTIGVQFRSPAVCKALNASLAIVDVNVRTLGASVGRLVDHNGTCPEVDSKRPTRAVYSKYSVNYEIGARPWLQTLQTEIQVRLQDASPFVCIKTFLTPEPHPIMSAILTYFPLAILLLVAISTAITRIRGSEKRQTAAEDGTPEFEPVEAFIPGIRDCLQYIQFAVLMGCLTLSYPGFFKPAVSHSAWSTLLYSYTLVHHGFTYPGIEDHIYQTNGTYGLELMAQTLGASTMSDIWVDATINLCLTVLVVILLIFLVQFFSLKRRPVTRRRYFWRDHLQLIGWNATRMILSYFVFPIVAFTSYQFLLSDFFPVYHTTIAACYVVILGCALIYVIRYLSITDQSSLFFDDSGNSTRRQRITTSSWVEQSVYCLPYFRGLAIGALQEWGLVQLVILGVCELYLFGVVIGSPNSVISRPRTICLAMARLTTISLVSTFHPLAKFTEGTKGYVGYTILLLHIVVLLFCFLLPSIWRLVLAFLRQRNTKESGGLEGGEDLQIYGPRQLSRRTARSQEFLSAGPQDCGGIPLSPVPEPEITKQNRKRPSRDTLHLSPVDAAEHSNRATSPFYRQPRTRSTYGQALVTDTKSALVASTSTKSKSTINSTTGPPNHSGASSSDSGTLGEPSSSFESESSWNMSTSPNVDYSVRESDLFFAPPPSSFNRRGMASRQRVQNQTASTGGQGQWVQAIWKRWTSKGETGFSVARP